MRINPRPVVLAAFLFLLFALMPVAQLFAEGEFQVSARVVGLGEANELQLLAKVLDSNGRPVSGLSVDSFQLTIDRQDYVAGDVQSVVDARVAISSLLVIDTSGSMQGSAPLEDARLAASQYVGSQDPIDSVGVIGFANGTEVIADYSSDFTAVRNALDGLEADGNTALFESVVAAAGSIAGREGARRVVILLSDGENFGPSETTREEALEAARSTGVPFYVIGLGPALDQQFLQDLAAATQGEMYLAPSSEQLTSLFGQIGEVLRSEYLVTVSLAESGLQGDVAAMLKVSYGGQTGEAPLSLELPVVQAPSAGTPIAVPQPAASKPVAESGGNGALQWGLLGLLGAVLVAGLAVFLKQSYDRRAPVLLTTSEAGTSSRLREEDMAVARTSPLAMLRSDSGEEILFSGLATLGVDSNCTFRLPVSPSAFGHGELRIWFANQRYLIHDVSPRSRIKVNGQGVAWTFLNDGDEIEVCGVKLRYGSTGAEPAQRY